MNFLLSGSLPEFIRRTVFGATLTAFNKADGGLRPIAVGTLYRRLSTKVGLRPISTPLGEKLAPVQLGFGVRTGCEAAAHATRWFYEHMPPDSVMAQVDMANAFNTLRRDKFLEMARIEVPTLYPLLWQAYSAPTPLFFGSHVLESCTGVQQGDPAGPAIFALTLNQVTRRINTEFNSWYLDDGCIGGPLNSIMSTLTELTPALMELGLRVNASKCAITLPPSSSNLDAVTCVRRALPDAHVTDSRHLVHLGAPLSQDSIAPALALKTSKFRLMTERLNKIGPHTAFFLLTKCLGIPKLMYLVKTSHAMKFAPSNSKPSMRSCNARSAIS